MWFTKFGAIKCEGLQIGPGSTMTVRSAICLTGIAPVRESVSPGPGLRALHASADLKEAKEPEVCTDEAELAQSSRQVS